MIRLSFSSSWLPMCISLLCASLLLCVSGCGESKKSLHEMDHVTPAHWPTDLTDAANKLSARLKVVQTSSAEANGESRVALKELTDLVGWVPEVAADTDLAESDWVRVFEGSESVRKQLLGAKGIEASVAEEIEKLCSLLVQSQALIPKPALSEALDGDDQTSADKAAE
jgi:hypothetical protein